MFFGRIAAQLLAFAAIAGVFGEIPIVSEWAFWFMVGAYLLSMALTAWALNGYQATAHGNHRADYSCHLVFVDIPWVSNFTFWVMAAAYVIIVASTDIVRHTE